MNTNTLIDVIAIIDVKVANLNAYMDNHLNATCKPDTEYYLALAQCNVLNELSRDLQRAIEADISAMESNTGE